MDLIFLSGRLIYGGFFLWSGINHILESGVMTGYTASKGVPFPRLAVYLSGFMILFGGLGVIVGGIFLFWSLALIAVFMLAVSFAIHNFWAIKDRAERKAEFMNFAKNMGIFGATLMLMVLVYGTQISQAWPFLL